MKQKRRIKIWIVLIIVWVMSFSDWSFATVSVKWEFWTLPWLLNFLISIVSWLWIVFAKIAWEFLTNKWVYGEALWIDVLLWKYWNIVKNMANFCLWFYLVYVIFKWLIWQYGGKEDVMKNLKGMLLWVLIAWVWIQASWFLTSVVVDISTIALTAVWSLPAQIISENEKLEEAVELSLKNFGSWWNVYELFSEDGSANGFTKTVKVSINKNLTNKEFIDEILPKKDSVSGPLYYMWWSIVRTNQINSVDDTNLKKSIINLIIQWWTTIIYSIEIAVLCVLALMRILYLWMFIVLSPLAVLLACLQKSWEKNLMSKWFVSSLMKQINLKTFFLKVFQPSVVVLWISLCLIFVSLINQVINKDSTRSVDNFDIGGARISALKDTTTATKSDDETYTTKIDWNLLKLSISSIWKWFLDFMMAIITVVLVYLAIEMAVKMWWWDDFVSKHINSLQDSVKNAMTSIPIVPMPWYDKQWVATTRAVSLKWLKSLPQDKLGFETRRKEMVTSKQVDSIMEKWWLSGENSLTESQKAAITAAWTNGEMWLWILQAKLDYINNESNKIKSDKWKWMILDPNALDQYWIWEFTNWLNERVDKNDYAWISQPWKKMIDDWKNIDPDKSKRTLKTLFDKPNHANTYANFFGYTSWNYANFDSIMNLDISEK